MAELTYRDLKELEATEIEEVVPGAGVEEISGEAFAEPSEKDVLPSEPEEPSHPVAEPWDDSFHDDVAMKDSRRRAEKEFEARIARSEKFLAQCAVEVERLKDELKAARADAKDAVEALSSIRRQGPIYREPLSDLDEPEPDENQAEGDAPEATSHPADESWRNVPTAEVLPKNMKGLGAKKLDALLTACPTLGDMEDLRAGEGLTSLAGIGETLNSQIEEAIVQWWSERAGETC